ncbi:hypothetical protein BH20ACT5_BH20ACT5_07200 [soil metagenome]
MLRRPIESGTYTPIAVVHATVRPGAELDLPWRPDFNGLLYVLSGRGSVGVAARPIRGGQLAVYGAGDVLRVRADAQQDGHSPALEAIVLGGAAIREPIARYGPFVMNTRDEIIQAFEDYQAGQLGTPRAGYHGVLGRSGGQRYRGSRHIRIDKPSRTRG